MNDGQEKPSTVDYDKAAVWLLFIASCLGGLAAGLASSSMFIGLLTCGSIASSLACIGLKTEIGPSISIKSS